METLDISSTGIGASELNKSNSSSEEIIKAEQIGDTPFLLVKQNGSEKGFVAIGEYKLTETEVSMREAEVLTGGEDWKFMIAVIGAITDQIVRTYTKGEISNGE